MEIYSNPEDGEEYAIPIQNIPKKVKFSFMAKEYTLAGIVNFKAPMKQTRNNIYESIGHYTAISYRRNQWIKYDDCKELEITLSDYYTACTHIILYIA